MPTVYDCQTCGAYCINAWGGRDYVALEEGEGRRLRRRGLPIITDSHGQEYLGTRRHNGPGGDTSAPRSPARSAATAAARSIGSGPRSTWPSSQAVRNVGRLAKRPALRTDAGPLPNN